VVCTYNGGRTLEQCLRSLRALDYPNYEVVVVDDGSTDDTPAILNCARDWWQEDRGACGSDVAGREPSFPVVRQANRGLSVARNVGLRHATGDIIAFTDSDCFADPDWLTCLAHRFGSCDAAAVGGPNLTPNDGCLAACVAAAPGQPTHVLH